MKNISLEENAFNNPIYFLIIVGARIKEGYSERKKGGLQNPSKRFCRFLKASKCVQSLKKRIKNSTEPFEGSVFYPVAEPFLTKLFFRFYTAKRGSVRKYETLKVQYKTIRI